MKLTRAKLREIIKEELEVILTDDEAAELFGANFATPTKPLTLPKQEVHTPPEGQE